MKKLLLAFLIIQCYFAGSQSLHKLNKDLPCVNKEYNIFAHVVCNSSYKTIPANYIQSAIDEANRMFAPICISFKLCEIDTVKNYNFNSLSPESELDELSTLFIAQNRINVYFVTDFLIDPNTAGICKGYVGSILNGNIFLKSSWALTHELGHFFGLKHTFEGGDELVNGSNCETAGDKICDTPADPYVVPDSMHWYVNNCTFISMKRDQNGQFYQPDVGNVMSYYPCPCGFTVGQYLFMANNYFLASKKHW